MYSSGALDAKGLFSFMKDIVRLRVAVVPNDIPSDSSRNESGLS